MGGKGKGEGREMGEEGKKGGECLTSAVKKVKVAHTRLPTT